MKKTLYFSLIMLGASIVSRMDAYKVSLYNASDKLIQFVVYSEMYIERSGKQKAGTMEQSSSKITKPGREDAIRGFGCVKKIDFHVVGPNGKTSEEKITKDNQKSCAHKPSFEARIIDGKLVVKEK